MDNRLNDKSYNKSKTVRRLLRQQMFQRNRKPSSQSYLSYYNEQQQNCIQQSLVGPLPDRLPDYSNICRNNISYFRRSGKWVYKTRAAEQEGPDFHMTFQSLWALAGVESVEMYDDYEKVIRQFQNNLSQYLQMPSEIKEMAILAAGNKILGKEQDILAISSQDHNQLWVLINHVYQRKITFTSMYSFLRTNLPIVYRTIYEMTNNYKDEIIESIMGKEGVLEHIVGAMNGEQGEGSEVQMYCVRIVGNILAEREDFTEIFMKYGLMDRMQKLLQGLNQQGFDKKMRQELKKDILWLLSNYICDSPPANDVLYRQNLLAKILVLYRDENQLKIKLEVYYVLFYLAYYGDRLTIYKLAVQEKWLAQCCTDIEIQNQQLTLLVLNLIGKLAEIGEEYVSEYESQDMADRNPFTYDIVNSKLKTYIHAKTYNKNLEISNISFTIMDYVEEFQSKFGDMDESM